MVPALAFEMIPHVLDDDEVPFVIGFARDPRPFLDVDGAQLRRSRDRCVIDFNLDPFRLRATMMLDEGNCRLTANAGPIINDWWPLLERVAVNSHRPFLSAGVAHHPVTMTSGANVPLRVAVVPPSSVWNATVLVIGLGQGGMTEENLVLGRAVALCVIKAALLTFGEYRSLVGDVPETVVQSDGMSLPLSQMLIVAEQASEAIDWECLTS